MGNKVKFNTPSKEEIEYLIEKKTKSNSSAICLSLVNLFFTICNISLTLALLALTYN